MAEEPEHLHLPSLQIIGARQVDGKWIANYRDKKNKSQVTKAFDTQQEAVERQRDWHRCNATSFILRRAGGVSNPNAQAFKTAKRAGPRDRGGGDSLKRVLARSL